MQKRLKKIISFLICFLLIFEQSLPAGRQVAFAQVAPALDISGVFAGLRNSLVQDKFRPVHLRYLNYDNAANNFNLLLDKGDAENINKTNLEDSTKTLLKYFFIGISIPNEKFWVNLRPDATDNIIDPALARTDAGKILLEADLQLKKDTALATSPKTPEGKAYWDKLYKKAGEIFGNENVSIPTLTRPWIVPEEIIIRESSANAYIYKATLKVMLESDYLTNSTNPANSAYAFKDPRQKALNEYSSELIRQTIIPKLTREINTSKRYAPLRQLYYSLILAHWFKSRFYGKGGLYSWAIDKENLTGITSQEAWSKDFYFNEYKKSFTSGEYDIQEPTFTPSGQVIRSYFSGGIKLSLEGMPLAPSVSSPITLKGPVRAIWGDVNRTPSGSNITGMSVVNSSPVVNNPFDRLTITTGNHTVSASPAGPEKSAAAASSPVEMSRRGFLKFAGAAVGAAALGTTGYLGRIFMDNHSESHRVYSSFEKEAQEILRQEIANKFSGPFGKLIFAWAELRGPRNDKQKFNRDKLLIDIQKILYAQKVVTDNIDIIKEAAKEFNADPLFLASIIFSEQMDFVSESYVHNEGVADAAGALMGRNTSVGLGQVRITTFIKLWDEYNGAKTKDMPYRRIAELLQDPRINIRTAAKLVRQLTDELTGPLWKDYLDLRVASAYTTEVELVKKSQPHLPPFNKQHYSDYTEGTAIPTILNAYYYGHRVLLSREFIKQRGIFADSIILAPASSPAFVPLWESAPTLREALALAKDIHEKSQAVDEWRMKAGFIEEARQFFVGTENDVEKFLLLWALCANAAEDYAKSGGAKYDSSSLDALVELSFERLAFEEDRELILKALEHLDRKKAAERIEEEFRKSKITNKARKHILKLLCAWAPSEQLSRIRLEKLFIEAAQTKPEENILLKRVRESLVSEGMPRNGISLYIKRLRDLKSPTTAGPGVSSSPVAPEKSGVASSPAAGDSLITPPTVDANKAVPVIESMIQEKRKVLQLSGENRPVVIWIDGDQASGKSFFAKYITPRLSRSRMLSLDDYVDQNAESDSLFGAPKNWERLVSGVDSLIAASQLDSMFIEDYKALDAKRDRISVPMDITIRMQPDDQTRRGNIRRRLVKLYGEHYVDDSMVGRRMQVTTDYPSYQQVSYDLIVDNSLGKRPDREEVYGQEVATGGKDAASSPAANSPVEVVRQEVGNLANIIRPKLDEAERLVKALTPESLLSVNTELVFARLGALTKQIFEARVQAEARLLQEAEEIGSSNENISMFLQALNAALAHHINTGVIIIQGRYNNAKKYANALTGDDIETMLKGLDRIKKLLGLSSISEVRVNKELSQIYIPGVDTVKIDSYPYVVDASFIPRFSPARVVPSPSGTDEGIVSSPVSDINQNKGGIDFRALPIVTQPGLSLGTVHLKDPALALTRRVPINADKEWQEIRNMLNAGIVPSSQRLKDFAAASCVNKDFEKDIDKILGCIADIFRMEEDRVAETDPALTDLVVLLESKNQTQELVLGLNNIQVVAREPKRIEE